MIMQTLKLDIWTFLLNDVYIMPYLYPIILSNLDKLTFYNLCLHMQLIHLFYQLSLFCFINKKNPWLLAIYSIQCPKYKSYKSFSLKSQDCKEQGNVQWFHFIDAWVLTPAFWNDVQSQSSLVSVFPTHVIAYLMCRNVIYSLKSYLYCT